jgi:hypothetical protein
MFVFLQQSTVRPVTLAEAMHFVEADTETSATEASGHSSGLQDQDSSHSSSNPPSSASGNESSSNYSDINMPPPRPRHKEMDSQISQINNISQTFSGSIEDYN